MIVKDIIKIIEKTAPLDLQYSWDNSGFLCGSIDKAVNKLYLTLDVNKYTVDEAVRVGADMIISHHPILFKGASHIDFDDPQGYILKELIKNDIALYSSHTPMDTADGGINDVLAAKLGIHNTEIIEKNEKYPGCGLGRIGDLNDSITIEEFAETVKKALHTPFVRICGEPGTKVKKAAVGSGACDDLIPEAKKMGADVMVTADMKYHISIDSVESGICVIDAGHYPTEIFVIDIFEKILSECGAEIFKASEKDIFRII